jgi:hypothetical protein
MPISFQHFDLPAFKYRGRASGAALTISLITISFLVLPNQRAFAQNPAMEQKLEQIKQASAANKQELAHFTWQEQQVISLKGDVKKTVVYQVSIGPDGTQQKTQLSSLPAPAPPSGRRLKQHIVEKKTDEFEEYGQQIAALAKQYTQPDPQAMQQAHQQGNISLQPGGGEGTSSLVIKNYLKPDDTMTLVFNSEAKAIQSLQVSSYLSDPKDAVTLAVQFARLPGGPNHVASIQVDGVSKQMTVAIQNSNYQQSQ